MLVEQVRSRPRDQYVDEDASVDESANQTCGDQYVDEEQQLVANACEMGVACEERCLWKGISRRCWRRDTISSGTSCRRSVAHKRRIRLRHKRKILSLAQDMLEGIEPLC